MMASADFSSPNTNNDIDEDDSLYIIDRYAAMPYEHPGIDCSAHRVKLSETELLQYVNGEKIIDETYLWEKKKREQINEDEVMDQEREFWERFWEQRKHQRDLLNSGVNLVLNEDGQLTQDTSAAVGEENNINQVPRAQQQQQQQQNPPLFPFIAGFAVAGNHGLDHGAEHLIEAEEERQLRAQDEQRQRETEAIIARHVQQLGNNTDFEVVRMFPETETRLTLPNNNLTIRRICIAVVAVAASFVCIMIQSLPPPYYTDEKEITSHTMERDHLMHDLFDIRDWYTHLSFCSLGYPKIKVKVKTTTLFKYFIRDTYYDCSAGVLHIPARKKIIARGETGISAIWKMDCDFPVGRQHRDLILSRNLTFHGDSSTSQATCKEEQQLEGSTKQITSCKLKDPVSGVLAEQQCFRGIHDDILVPEEVDYLIQLASTLIEEGGDHVTIRNDTETLLTGNAATVLKKVEQLLYRHYKAGPRSVNNKSFIIKPVAFRFHAAISPLPHNPHESTPANHLLERLINQTVIRDWIQPIYEKHVKTSFLYLLSSVKTSVLLTSDPCVLTSDLEMRPDFIFHTSIFLADKGLGEDFTGGAAFYVQEKEWNAHRRWRSRHKIQSGLAIDGSRGRVIVSTGGNENLHCHLPLKSGVRAALQIWWDTKKEL